MQDQLEAYVDQYGLYGVLEKLQQVCYEKQDHVQSNWQDAALAKLWEKRAQIVGWAAAHLSMRD